ncbi:MAG: PKD domain-containing protein, partial [Chthoniobacterales bacterium]
MVSEANPTVTYQAGPFTASNQSPIFQVDDGPRCDAANPCDSYVLTLSLPSGYAAAHPNAALRVTAGWTDTGSGQSDYDLYIFKGVVGDLDGSRSADSQSTSSANPEVAYPGSLRDGESKFTIKIVPVTATGETVKVKIDLLAGTPGGPAFGGPDPVAPGVPRYQIFVPPKGSAAESRSGEFNIGFNPKTGRIMLMNTGPIFRLTPPELLKPAKPECCEGLWEDKSSTVTNTGLDPILFTDQKSGRTFASNSTAGANASYAFTDDDGDSYKPVGISPPSGADHQTIGTGPYPAALGAVGNPAVNQGQYVLYCSQDLVGSLCQRSDDLGASYGPGVAATGPGAMAPKDCGGLHGHVRIAPNGTAWLPDKSCGNNQGGGVSKDADTTPWTEFTVKKAAADANGPAFTSRKQIDGGADPSVGLDTDSRAYYAYVNNEPVAANQPPEGHVHVAISEDNGTTWIRDIDVGTSHGIKNAAHVEAIAGSSGRAAVSFFGTDKSGDYQAVDFSGKWYLFIATTYDAGRTWVTVNATPNDPVQSMTGIWQRGGSQIDRNLLDFNEITVDSKGRPLSGYSDGCVTAACIGGTAGNDFVAHMRVARQNGGKTLFASNDANTDTTTPLPAKPPCLSGTRDATASRLTWKEPDNGGSPITNYYIYRGTVSGGFDFLAPLGQTGSAKTTFDDLTADPAVKDYFYVVKAINVLGLGAQSNEVDLVVGAAPPPVLSPCAIPGVLLVQDPAGDQTGGSANSDLDVLSVSIAEPYFSDGSSKLIFTMKLKDLSTIAPNRQWRIIWTPPVAPGNGEDRYYVGANSNAGGSPAAATFEYGTVSSTGNVPTTRGAADKGVITVKDGTIQITISNSKVGNAKARDAFIGISARNFAGTGTATLTKTSATDSTNDVGYVLAGNASCFPNAAPTAVLTGAPERGSAPLTVNFSGAGSSDPDAGDSIASYTFDFGDGTNQVTQSSPTVTHTYASGGVYPARLTVADSRGLVSTNTGLVLISVNATLRNISTRGFVQTGDNVVIGGYIVTGDQPRKVIVRGIG